MEVEYSTVWVTKQTQTIINEMKTKYGFVSANEVLMIALSLLEKFLEAKVVEAKQNE